MTETQFLSDLPLSNQKDVMEMQKKILCHLVYLMKEGLLPADKGQEIIIADSAIQKTYEKYRLKMILNFDSDTVELDIHDMTGVLK